MAANWAAKQVRTKPGFNKLRVHDLSQNVHSIHRHIAPRMFSGEYSSTRIGTCFSVTEMRQKRLKLTFRQPFRVKGVSRMLPAGDYELVPDQELTAEYYLPAYRPVVALIRMPSQGHRCSSIAKASVDLADILASHQLDQNRAATLTERG